MPGPLFQLLQRKLGSTGGARDAIAEVAEVLGATATPSDDEILSGLALCQRGTPPDSVSRYLSWRDFEGFCSDILRAKGYLVRENVYLKKPRAQIDVFGRSRNISVALDCKHWSRTPGVSTLAKLIESQKGRARRLHETLVPVAPVVCVIVLLTDPGVRFVSGGAVVPIFALSDFLDNVSAYLDYVETV
jgi:Restriction endonuclease